MARAFDSTKFLTTDANAELKVFPRRSDLVFAPYGCWANTRLITINPLFFCDPALATDHWPLSFASLREAVFLFK